MNQKKKIFVLYKKKKTIIKNLFLSYFISIYNSVFCRFFASDVYEAKLGLCGNGSINNLKQFYVFFLF